MDKSQKIIIAILALLAVAIASFIYIISTTEPANPIVLEEKVTPKPAVVAKVTTVDSEETEDVVEEEEKTTTENNQENASVVETVAYEYEAVMKSDLKNKPLPVREATQDVLLEGKVEVAKEKITKKTQPTQASAESAWKLLDTDLDNRHFDYANVWFSREDKQSVFIYFITYGECDGCFDYSTNYLQVNKATGIISKLIFEDSNNPVFNKTVNKSTFLFNTDKTKFTFIIFDPTNKEQSVYVFDVLKGTISLVTVLAEKDGVAELGLGYYIPEHENLWWKNNNTLYINNREFTNL